MVEVKVVAVSADRMVEVTFVVENGDNGRGQGCGSKRRQNGRGQGYSSVL